MKSKTVIKMENHSSSIELSSSGFDPDTGSYVYLAVGKWENETGGCDGEEIELTLSDVDDLICALEKIKELSRVE